jgi:RNA polymerase sigma-B factor
MSRDVAGSALDRPAPAERRVARTRDLLEASIDRATSQLTKPCRSVGLPLRSLGIVERPMVEPSVWLAHVRYARNRDAGTRDDLVTHYLSYARSLAARCYRHREPLEDLRQVATEGLLVALERFRPERRRPFVAFARPTIEGMIKRHYRDVGWGVRVPRWVHDLAPSIRRVQEMLEQDLGRPPTDAEVADVLDVDPSQVRATRRAERARSTTSIEAIDDDDHGSPSLQLPVHDVDLEHVDVRTSLAQTVRGLPADDRDLLGLYFVDNLSQAKIAEQQGVSQMQISRRLGAIVRRLRSHLAES